MLYADEGEDESFDPIGPGARISEIIEPSPPRPVVRKRPDPGEIDAAPLQHGCDMAAESGGNTGVSEVPRIINPRHSGNGSTAVILYTTPHRQFWVNGQHTADENGELAVSDPTVVETLLRAGCRPKAQ